MSRDVDAVVERLRQTGRAREARAVELVQALYGDLKLADLILLIRAATEQDSPLARVRYMDRLMAAWDDATAFLVEPPDGLAQAVRDAVQAGVRGTAEMFAAQQVVMDAFAVPATLQLQWMEGAEARMRQFWGNEPVRFRQEVAGVLRAGLERGQGIDLIARNLRDRTRVSRTRAIRIARNEVGNAAAFAMRESQREAGSEWYIWRSASDDRVRDLHRARNGKAFRWDDPPEGGAPGEDFLCRCVALAVPPS